MAGDDDLVVVKKSLFDSLRQHCECCPYIGEQLQGLSDGRAVVIPGVCPSSEPSKKRKTLHGSGPQEGSQPSHSSQQPDPQLSSQPSQQPGSQFPSQSSNTSQRKRPKRAGAKRPRKSAAADWFLKNAPTATEWRKRQTELELNTVEQYEQVIRAFTDRTNVIVEREPYQGDGHSEHELIDLAERFAMVTRDSLTNAKLQRSFASFQVLILLSYCEVLRKRGVPYETIDPIIQHVAGGECGRRRILDSAPWINGLIADLVSEGWTIYRATELFFIDALSITYLLYIHDNENPQSILEHLKRDEFMKHDYSDCLRPEYTIPGLIASLLDACNTTANKPSIDEICVALGYNSDCVPKSVDSIYKVHAASKSTPVTSLELDFDVLVPNSFESNDGPLTSVPNPCPPVQQSVQSKTKNSARWRNTVINVLNDHSRDHQDFLSARKVPTNALGRPVASIQNTDDSAVSLSVLLYSLGGCGIREDILYRGLFPQKRWNDHGNVHEVTLHDAGLNEQVVHLFSNRIKLDQAIKSCIQLDLIVLDILVNDSPTYSISDQSRHQISQSFKHEELSRLGLMFVAHIYPRDQTLEPSFQNLGKLLLPHLERTWQYVQGEPRPILPAHARDNLVEASLAGCRLAATSRPTDMISVLIKIQDTGLPDHLRMEISNRQSISLRFKGDHDQSDVVIQDILKRIAIDSTDTRSHCSYGRLLLSRTENAILRKEFNKAGLYLASWEVKNSPPSGLELQVVRMKNTVIGRVSRYEGQFEHARYCLEECLKTIPNDASRYHVMHHLADVYCELKSSGEAENLVLDEVKQLRAQGKQHSKPFRRLALPLVEAYIEQRMLEAARTVLRELLNIYDEIASHDVADQLGHVRAMIGLARVGWYESRWSEAHQSLENALGLTGKYKTFSKRNFYIGFIHLFLSVVCFELRQYTEARRVFALANDILCEQVPRHFMPGMGSYFLERLVLRAESL